MLSAAAASLTACGSAPPSPSASSSSSSSSISASTADGCSAPPCARGTFYQPLLAHVARTPEQWQAWAAALAAVGVRRLLLQHTALEPYDVLVPAAAAWRSTPGGAALGHVLDAALRHGIRVWIGLSYDPRFWNEIDTGDAAVLATYLAQRKARQFALAEALRPATAHPGAGGWYLSDEIDDLSWVAPQRAELLARWLDDVTRRLRQVAPALPIAVSGFVHGDATPPAALAAQWAHWLDASPMLDEVLLQDGIGAGKTTLANWPGALHAVAAAARARGRRCTTVVELFASASAGGAERVPAPVARVATQLQIAQRNGAEWVAFSVPEFVTTGQADARPLHAFLAESCAASSSSC